MVEALFGPQNALSEEKFAGAVGDAVPHRFV